MKSKNLTESQLKKAFKYYCLGLNSKEIAKLMDCSFRTIQNYMSSDNWKEKRKQQTTAKPTD